MYHFLVQVFCDEAATSIMSDDGVLQNIVKEQPDKENPDRQFNLMLQINVYDKNTSLNILVPKGFAMGTINSDNPKFLYFMGNATVINVSFQVGSKYQPTKLLDEMIQAMQAWNK